MSKKCISEVNGYRLIFMPEHPKALFTTGHQGYVYEHIFVAEKFLGRSLNDNEVVHHLDGNRSNNRHGNLLVLLRSEHSKLHQFLIKLDKKEEVKYCYVCGKTLQDKQINTCSVECFSQKSRKVVRPSKQELIEDIKNLSFVKIGKKYGVSDNAIRKWAKAYKINIKEVLFSKQVKTI